MMGTPSPTTVRTVLVHAKFVRPHAFTGQATPSPVVTGYGKWAMKLVMMAIPPMVTAVALTVLKRFVATVRSTAAKTVMMAIPPTVMAVPIPVQWNPVGSAPVVWFVLLSVATTSKKPAKSATTAVPIAVNARGHNLKRLVMFVVTAKSKRVQLGIAEMAYCKATMKTATMVPTTATLAEKGRTCESRCTLPPPRNASIP